MVAKKRRRLPTSSSGLVAELREEVHEYHLEVTKALATMSANCGHCQKRVSAIDLEIHGENPEREDAPGLKKILDKQVSELGYLKRSIHITWGVVTTIIGLLGGYVTIIWKK